MDVSIIIEINGYFAVEQNVSDEDILLLNNTIKSIFKDLSIKGNDFDITSFEEADNLYEGEISANAIVNVNGRVISDESVGYSSIDINENIDIDSINTYIDEVLKEKINFPIYYHFSVESEIDSYEEMRA